MRTFEQILEDDYHINLEDNRRDESMKLAAEKYAAQNQVPTDEEIEALFERYYDSIHNGYILMSPQGFSFALKSALQTK